MIMLLVQQKWFRDNGKAIVFENQNVIESLDRETLEELSEWDGPTFELDE